MKVAYLNVFQWSARLYNGAHYHGTLSYDNLSVPVLYKLTTRDARELNKKDPGASYSPGDESHRFCSLELLEARAIEVCQKEFPDAKVLIRGSSFCCEPQRILIGPVELNAIYEAYQLETSTKVARKLWRQWFNLIKETCAC